MVARGGTSKDTSPPNELGGGTRRHCHVAVGRMPLSDRSMTWALFARSSSARDVYLSLMPEDSASGVMPELDGEGTPSLWCGGTWKDKEFDRITG